MHSLQWFHGERTNASTARSMPGIMWNYPTLAKYRLRNTRLVKEFSSECGNPPRRPLGGECSSASFSTARECGNKYAGISGITAIGRIIVPMGASRSHSARFGRIPEAPGRVSDRRKDG
jgi:hypothetical protein